MTYVRPLGDAAIVGTADGGGYTLGDFLGAIMNSAKGLETATAADVPTASGGTSITAADFSTAMPGVCKPTNLTALGYVKSLQNQLNRVAQMKGFPKIGVDGEIGQGTLALFAKVQTAAGATQIMGSPSSCLGVAPDADVLSAQVQAYADSLGAPAKVGPSQLAVKAPTIVRPNGQEVAETGVMGAFDQLATIEKLAVVGVAGGIGYLLMTAKKKRKAGRR
jgi:hypothetical protein